MVCCKMAKQFSYCAECSMTILPVADVASLRSKG